MKNLSKKEIGFVCFLFSALLLVSSCDLFNLNHSKPGTYTVRQFYERLTPGIERITADRSKTGITLSQDGKTLNVYGIKLKGDTSDLWFPEGLKYADLSGLDISQLSGVGTWFSGRTHINRTKCLYELQFSEKHQYSGQCNGNRSFRFFVM